MRREVAWCIFRIIELGGTIPTPALSMLVRRLGEVIADQPGRAPASLLGMAGRDWCQQIQRAAHRRTGRLPAAATMRNIRALLARMMRLLATACDTGPWWQLDQWNPVEDTRIPLRDHEPMGRYAVRFDRIGMPWLRRGLQWHCKVGLETGTLRWSTVHRRIVAVTELDSFLRSRQASGPCLAEGPGQVRALMLDFLGHLRVREAARGRGAGRRLSPALRCSAWPATLSSSTCSWPTARKQRPPRWPSPAGCSSDPSMPGSTGAASFPASPAPSLGERSSTTTP